jgi:hypothetical protein
MFGKLIERGSVWIQVGMLMVSIGNFIGSLSSLYDVPPAILDQTIPTAYVCDMYPDGETSAGSSVSFNEAQSQRMTRLFSKH